VERPAKLLLADVFVPQRGIRTNEISEHRSTLLIGQVNYFDTVFSKPVDAAAKILRLTNDDRADVKLTNQPTAVPARRKGGYHDFVAVTAQPAGLPERVCLRVHGRVLFLHTQIVASAKNFTVGIKKRCTDGNAAFRKAYASFSYGDAEKLRSFGFVHADRFYRVIANCAFYEFKRRRGRRPQEQIRPRRE
jgi:hypothetical protein